MDEAMIDSATNVRTITCSHTTVISRQSRVVPSVCRVCRAPALYSYYGAVVCSACKIFFRRNAEKEQMPFRCLSDGHCKIDINDRYRCSHCRLIKCFAYGMHPDYFRGSFPTKKSNWRRKLKTNQTKTTSTDLVRKSEPEQIPALNLLRSDRSTLSSDQWNLLSNLIHCYDEHSGLSLCHRFICEQNVLSPKLRYRCRPVGEFMLMTMNGTELFFKRNKHFLSLCSHDRLTLVRMAFKHMSCLASNYVLHQTGLFDNTVFCQSAELYFGIDTLVAARRISDQLNFDVTFMKLILTLLAFSTTTYTIYRNHSMSNLTNIQAVLCIQDMYVEVAWRYLMYRYDHEEAVRWFSHLIRCLFSVNATIVGIDESTQYRDAVDSSIKQMEHNLTVTI